MKRHIEVIHKRSNRKGLAVQRRKSINKMSTRHKQRLTKSFLEHSALSENIRKEISDKVALSKLKGTQKLVNEQDAINMIQNANLSDRSVLKVMSPLRKKLGPGFVKPNIRDALIYEKQKMKELFNLEKLQFDVYDKEQKIYINKWR